MTKISPTVKAMIGVAPLALMPPQAEALPVVTTNALITMSAILLPVALGVGASYLLRRALFVVAAIAIVLAVYINGLATGQAGIHKQGLNGSGTEHVDIASVHDWESIVRLLEDSPRRHVTIVLDGEDAPHIEGLNIFHYEDHERIRDFLSKHPNTDTLIVVSQHLASLKHFRENFVTDAEIWLTPMPALESATQAYPYYIQGKTLTFHHYGSMFSPILPGPILPTLIDRDVVAVTGPGLRDEALPRGAILYDWVGATFKTDAELSASLRSSQRTEDATLLLPPGVSPSRSNPFIERLLKHAPYQKIAIASWDQVRARATPFNGDYFHSNRYQMHDIHGAIAFNPETRLVCLSSSCAEAISKRNRTFIDPSAALQITDGRLSLTPYSSAQAADLATADRVVIIAENQAEYGLASSLATSISELGGGVIAYATGHSGLYLPRRKADEGHINEDAAAILAYATGGARWLATKVRITDQRWVIPAVAAIGLFSGLLLAAGGGWGLLGLATMVTAYWLRHDWIWLSATHASSPIFHTWTVALAISAFTTYALGRQGHGVAAIIASLVSLLLIGTLELDTYAQTAMLSASIGSTAFVLLSLSKRWIPAGRWPKDYLGLKAKMTLPVTPLFMRGWIIDTRTLHKRLPLFPCKNFIIRSNHLTNAEVDVGGAFESRRVTRETYKQAMREMLAQDISQLGTATVQYWVQPYINCQATGVASSTAAGTPHSFTYSLDAPGSVTDGFSQDFRQRPRFGKLGSVDMAVLALLRRCEQSLGGPVVVEFGMIGNEAICFQVRAQSIDPNWEAGTLARILGSMQAPLVTGEYPVSTLEASLYSRFYDHTVYFINHTLYSIPATQKYALIDGVSLVQWVNRQLERSTIRHNALAFGRLIESLEDEARLIMFLKTQTRHGLTRKELIAVRDAINRAARRMGTGPQLSEEVPSGSDLHHAMIDILMAIAMKAARDSGIADEHGEERTLEAIENSVPPLPIVVAPTNNRWEVVPGSFKKKTVPLAEVEKDKNLAHKSILVADQIPPAKFHLLKKSEGVVSFFGSPVSHLALYCKAHGIPCRIGTGWRDAFEHRAHIKKQAR